MKLAALAKWLDQQATYFNIKYGEVNLKLDLHMSPELNYFLYIPLWQDLSFLKIQEKEHPVIENMLLLVRVAEETERDPDLSNQIAMAIEKALTGLELEVCS